MKISKVQAMALSAVCACSMVLLRPRAAIAWDLSPLVSYQVTTGRIITVDGAGAIQTAPDRALITLAVRIWNKELHTAYHENEERCRKVLALATTYHVEAKDIETNEISVTPTYQGGSSSSYYTPTAAHPEGYQVEKKIQIVVKELKALPELLTKSLDSGATDIVSVRFDSSSLRDCRDRARSLALQAAREKAEALAHDISGRLGRALVVTETGSQVRDLYSYSQANPYNNIAKSDDFKGETYESLAPGQLTVSSSLRVTFEVVD